MPNKSRKDPYQKLKLLGSKKEQQMNQKIQELLNKKEYIQSAAQHSQVIAHKVKKIQDSVEKLSVPFNIPTKKDVANVAKLSIQIEEKIDDMDEKLFYLINEIEELKQKTKKGKNTGDSPYDNTSTARNNRASSNRPYAAKRVNEKKKKVSSLFIAYLRDSLQNPKNPSSKLGERQWQI
ncbi:hypothetical protein ELQ35_09315 [Peribacillus cavernae]|uniref:Uncharacterized protein n=1 Tax=Peribacillus cavernae TaxID=1674310 RepID=A0A433HQB1_9BACI|nr:hypothetical protein [Peribacillus cavernae]MDQ0216994.1 hypothetical protein [Peribacillus cavernae]RUQ30521.1 hypothetical protein ELQ35_09315 [Peribacillus cavernae]